jgi:hypothetical protein
LYAVATSPIALPDGQTSAWSGKIALCKEGEKKELLIGM